MSISSTSNALKFVKRLRLEFIILNPVDSVASSFSLLYHTLHSAHLVHQIGHVMLLIMLIMYTTATRKIRTQCFEAFWYSHHLAFFFLLGLYTHASKFQVILFHRHDNWQKLIGKWGRIAGCFVRGALPGEEVQCLGYESWRWTIWGGIAYFAERMWREVSIFHQNIILHVFCSSNHKKR